MADIISIGEPLMELSNSQPGMYKEGFGGDTSNFLMAARRQGATVGYFTQIGQDTFGDKFMKLWADEDVDTSYVNRLVPTAQGGHTGLYFISYTEKGHEFTYFRAGSAASMMGPADVPEQMIKEAKLLHISGISQAISNSATDACFEACKLAKKNGTIVTYDPNFRPKLWSKERAAAIINATVPYVDIFMPSLEDVTLLSGMEDPDQICDYYHSIGVKVVVLKLGSKGVMVSADGVREVINGFKVDTIDQTGAGDCFDGSFCSRYIKGMSPVECAKYANACAALSTRGYGAVAPIPSEEEVLAFLADK